MHEMKQLLTLAVTAALAAGCVGARAQQLSRADRSLLAFDLARTRKAGTGVRFRPPARSAAVAAGVPVGGWRCLPRRLTSYGAHLELFARERGIVVPAGIGIRAPRFGGYRVTGGRCAYPLRTLDPTGLIEVAVRPGSPPPTLGDLFRLWGQSLAPDRLGAFTGEVRAYVNGRERGGDPRRIPLSRHIQVVLELGGFVRPHSAYTFPR